MILLGFGHFGCKTDGKLTRTAHLGNKNVGFFIVVRYANIMCVIFVVVVKVSPIINVYNEKNDKTTLIGNASYKDEQQNIKADEIVYDAKKEIYSTRIFSNSTTKNKSGIAWICWSVWEKILYHQF